jgi:hypothetical protein
MKRVLLILILALALLPIGCAQNTIRNYMDQMLGTHIVDYKITLVGDPGLDFSGRYTVVTPVYDPQTQNLAFNYDVYSVEGQIPPEGYMVYAAHDAIAVAASFQKRTADWTEFRVELWQGTDEIQQDATTDPWGMVMAAAIK